MPHNKDFETDSPIVTVLASASPARTRANYGSRLKSLLCGLLGLETRLWILSWDRLVPFSFDFFRKSCHGEVNRCT
jgi:hypothetical protein